MRPPPRQGLLNFPFYYGWIIAFVGTLGFIASSPGQTYAISIFLDHLLAEFDLKRTEFASIYMVATLASSMLVARMGQVVDKLGARKALVGVSLGLALSLMAASKTTSLLALGLVLFLLRLFGQGSMTLVSATMINQWWVRKRGRIMGGVGLAAAILGTGMFPSLIHYLIDNFQWRKAFQAQAFIIALVVTPIAALLARHRPEDHGLLADGDETLDSEPNEALKVEGLELEEARKTRIFWLAAAGVGMQAMLVTGLHFHAVAIFADKGLNATTAASSYLPISVSAALVTLLSGWWVEKTPVTKLLSLSLMLLSAAMVLCTQIQNSALLWLYMLLLGITSGLFRTVSTVIWSQLFGRKALGAITGLATSFMVAGSAFGPLPLGWAKDKFSSFDGMLLVLAVLPILLSVATLLTPEPDFTDR